MKTKRPNCDKINNLNDYVHTCRLCMTKGETMKQLFDNDSNIVKEIEYCTGITITENAMLPSSICTECITKLTIAQDFKTACISSEDTFLRLLEEYQSGITAGNEIVNDKDCGPCLTDENFFDDDYEKGKKVAVLGCAKDRPRKKQKSVHAPNKKLYCTKCGIHFENRKQLVVHIQTLHKEDLFLICEICGKQVHCTSWTSHNRAHFPPKYGCELCDYKTVHKGDLVKHIRTHTGEKSFQCHHCESTFTCSSNLIGHVQRRHLGERRHGCPRCHMAFHSKQKLLRHLDSHDNVKRYECEVCQSYFTRRTHLRHHLLRQHSITLPHPRPGRRRTHAATLDSPSTFNKLIN